jgi:hypothetical protein
MRDVQSDIRYKSDIWDKKKTSTGPEPVEVIMDLADLPERPISLYNYTTAFIVLSS